MNRKGFTLMELLATIVILGLIMLIIFPSITKLMKNNDSKKYDTYERMMVEYAIVSDILPDANNNIKLSQLNDLADVKRECTGYVHVIDKSKNEYKAYISCGENGEDYETTNFDSDYAG